MDTTLSIMFVDDDLPVLEGIRRTLAKKSRNRWGLSFFPSGLGALREIERQQPDVLVTDMRMPGMNGKILLEIVHVRFPGIQTFILSGQCSEQEALDLVRTKNRYFRKPFDRTGLLEVLRLVEDLQVEIPTETLIRNLLTNR
ncbi:MAG: response regulator [Rhodospirillaceae bacterium]|jgi:DNA-binding NtrC family response regulator|nr:response regulator [Rhodospirillaceae bacterium]